MRRRNKTVLVTGSGGLIGSRLAKRLVSLSANTRALIRYNSANSWGSLDYSSVKQEIEIISGDIRDRESLKHAFHDIDIVFYLAALIGILYSYHSRISFVRTNVEGTLNDLQSALEHYVVLVINTSTSEVYGTALYVLIDKTNPMQHKSITCKTFPYHINILSYYHEKLLCITIQSHDCCIQGLGFIGTTMAVAVASARNPEDELHFNVIGVIYQHWVG